MKLLMKIFGEGSDEPLEERDIDVEEIGDASAIIDEVILRDGQRMQADVTKDEEWHGKLTRRG